MIIVLQLASECPSESISKRGNIRRSCETVKLDVLLFIDHKATGILHTIMIHIVSVVISNINGNSDSNNRRISFLCSIHFYNV